MDREAPKPKTGEPDIPCITYVKRCRSPRDTSERSSVLEIPGISHHDSIILWLYSRDVPQGCTTLFSILATVYANTGIGTVKYGIGSAIGNVKSGTFK